MAKIAYVKHPISRDKIDILKSEGYKIVDVAFMPDGEKEYQFDNKKPSKGKGIGTDSGDQFSDAQLREIIGAVTGTSPSSAAKRESLIKRFNDLNEKQPDEAAEAIKLATEQGE